MMLTTSALQVLFCFSIPFDLEQNKCNLNLWPCKCKIFKRNSFSKTKYLWVKISGRGVRSQLIYLSIFVSQKFWKYLSESALHSFWIHVCHLQYSLMAGIVWSSRNVFIHMPDIPLKWLESQPQLRMSILAPAHDLFMEIVSWYWFFSMYGPKVSMRVF